MRKASQISTLFLAALLPAGPYGSEAAGRKAYAKLVWPNDYQAKLILAETALKNNGAGPNAWPKPLSEICDTVHFPRDHRICREAMSTHPLSLTLEMGAFPVEKRYPGSLPFEIFNNQWESARVDPELGQTWSELPPLMEVELQYPLSPRAFAYFRLGVRRDFAAWHDDPAGFNLPLSEKDVDLNEPSLGYLHWAGDFLAFTLGRFPIHWSPSPDFGLTLSHAVPYHNAAEFRLKAPKLQYHFLVSSFNPWLEGTPTGDTSSLDFPIGSEEWRQRHYRDEKGANNYHKRVYDARIKTLFAHRIETWMGPLTLGITEIQIIGGKFPDLRDANPFAFFHNDFKDGYVNSGLTLDGRLLLPLGISLSAELFMDDVRWGETEKEGSAPSLLGYLGAVHHSFSAYGRSFTQSLHGIRTDPFLYGYVTPYNTLTSRHILTSNFQHEGDSVFVDKYVIDYPVGYARGGDAFDFWYRLDAMGERLDLSLEAGLLAKGEIGTYSPYVDYYNGPKSSPSGIEERELRLRADAGYRWRHGLAFRGAVGWQGVQDAGHVEGRFLQHWQSSLGASWRFPD